MKLKNVFFKNPALYKAVTRMRKQVPVVPKQDSGVIRYVNGTGVITKYDYSIDLPLYPYLNGVGDFVDHCILVTMLDRFEDSSIETANCVLDRNEMRKVILYGDRFAVRGLTEVDDMVDLINFLLIHN